jgi:hypothetical protein
MRQIIDFESGTKTIIFVENLKLMIKKSIKNSHVYVPSSFDPLIHLPDDLQKYADSARYLLHRIHWGRVMRKSASDGYVMLKFDYLREIIPDKILKNLRNALERSKVIDCQKQYITGVKSYGYKFGQSVIGSPIVRTEIVEAKTSNRMLKQSKSDSQKIKLDVHKHLRGWLRKTKIDRLQALEMIKDHPRYDLVSLPIEAITNRDEHFVICRFGRVHSSLTNLISEVRPCLSIQGKQLVSIDIVNSQPFFLALLISKYRSSGNKAYANITFSSNSSKSSNPYLNISSALDSVIQTYESQLPGSNPIRTKKGNEKEKLVCIGPLSITASKTSEESKNTQEKQGNNEKKILAVKEQVNKTVSPDELHFIELCCTGKLYEFLQDELNIKSRKTAKEEFFLYVYGRNRQSSDVKTLFREEFPNVAAFIKEHKKKDHAFLAQLMQAVESNFVINIVCRRLMEFHKDVPVLTIHDSILTTQENVDLVHSILVEEFSGLGMTPELKITELSNLKQIS